MNHAANSLSLQPEPQWRIEMLGGLRLMPPGSGVSDAITHFPTRKTGALLAYLAYHQERSRYSRDSLADMLWPDNDVEKGRNALRVTLSRLRHVMGETGCDAEPLFITDKLSIGLKRQCVTTDVACFEKCLQAAAGADTLTERTRYLSEAVELYRGELLPDYEEGWIPAQAQRLEGLFFDALHNLLSLLEENREFERALRYAHHALSIDPLREETQRDLLRLYIAQGRYDAAHYHYDRFCKSLYKSSGALPSAVTQELMEPFLKKGLKTENNLTQALAGQSTNGALAPKPKNNPETENGSLLHYVHTAPYTGNSITLLLIDNLPRQSDDNTAGALHRARIRNLINQYGGHEFGELYGDALWSVFGAATNALSCALAIRQTPQALVQVTQQVTQQVPGDESTTGVDCAECRMALDTSDSGLWAGDDFDKEQNGQLRLKGAPANFLQTGIKSAALDRALSLLQAGHAGQTLCSEVTGALLRRALQTGVSLDDLGVYRLHNILTPERVYQVSCGVVQGRSFPPLQASPLHSSELPSSTTAFLGRQHDLKKIEKWLTPLPGRESQGPVTDQIAPDQAASQAPVQTPLQAPMRLVTLTGCGGCGKTRLALEAARCLQTAYHQAVWFVPLSGVRDPNLIIHAIVDALRLPGAPGLDPWVKVAAELGQKPSLLILDNFEQLHEGGVDVIKRLLHMVPTLSCLVTSRRTLLIPGEKEWPVSPLPVPPLTLPAAGEAEEKRRLRAIRESESVALFVDRARLARPSFELTPAYVDAVAQLCKLLEGLPLAIELVAAHAQGLTPPQILSLLEPYATQDSEQESKNPFDPLDIFHDERPETPERHRSLRAAIRWSYELLDSPLQKFFARLWVFKGGWTPDAAQFVAGDGKEIEDNQGEVDRVAHFARFLREAQSPADILSEDSFENVISSVTFEHLLQLQERSMILAEEQGAVIRFSLLDMLRRFAVEQVSETEAALLEARHAAYFLHLAEQAAGELMAGGRDKWLRRLDPEIDNLRAALAWTLRYEPRYCLQMAGALWRFWEARGLFAEGRDWLDRAFAAYNAVHPQSSSVKGQAEKGQAEHQNGSPLASGSGKSAIALKSSSSEVPLAEALPKSVYMRAVNGAARLAWYRADFSVARLLLGECLTLARLEEVRPSVNSSRNSTSSSPQQRWDVANALHSLGLVAMCQGDSSARAMLEEGLNLVRADGDRRVIKDFMLGLALVKFYMADSGVRELLSQALEISRELNDQRGIAFALNNLGMVEGIAGNYDAARDYHESSLPLLRDMGDKWSTARALSGLGRAAWFQGDVEAARAYYRENLIILRDLGSVWELVYTLEGFSWLALRDNKPQHAARLLGASDALREASGHVLFPVARPCYEECVAQTRAALAESGATAFESLWRRGRLLLREEAIAEALSKSTHKST